MQWIVSSYMLTFGCFLLLWGRIADLYGKRRVFIFGTAWMTVTTAANPFLPNEIVFDVFRGLQGLVGIGTNLILRPFIDCCRVPLPTFRQQSAFWVPPFCPEKPRHMHLLSTVSLTSFDIFNTDQSNHLNAETGF